MSKETALITGTTGGLGMEFVKIHAQKGGNLVLVGYLSTIPVDRYPIKQLNPSRIPESSCLKTLYIYMFT